jgi:kynurenine formamidase
MCLPLCLAQMAEASHRREFLKAAGLATATTVAGGGAAAAEPAPTILRYSRVVDLTHTLTPDFPTWGGGQQLAIEILETLAKDGWNVRQWTVDEHTGTHLDAPFHKSGGDTADRIPAAHLIGPLAVVDIRTRAAGDADAELTPDDLHAWERQHGPLPAGAIVAMHSGWDAHVRTARFRNVDGKGAMHFPGFHVEAADFLVRERDVKGILVDTLSLDRGVTTTFPVHLRWLGSNRWGLECAANLGQLPPSGATIIVGGPKIAGATGGPSRVFALV